MPVREKYHFCRVSCTKCPGIGLGCSMVPCGLSLMPCLAAFVLVVVPPASALRSFSEICFVMPIMGAGTPGWGSPHHHPALWTPVWHSSESSHCCCLGVLYFQAHRFTRLLCLTFFSDQQARQLWFSKPLAPSQSAGRHGSSLGLGHASCPLTSTAGAAGRRDWG